MPDEMRHSRADEAEIINDPEQLARQEAHNGLKQFQAVVEMVEFFLQPERPFKFRTSHLLRLHRIALQGISAYAGNWRPANIEIGGSRHKPPGAFEIPEQIEALCDYVNDKWQEKSPLHLASYVLWEAELDPSVYRWKWTNIQSGVIHDSLFETGLPVARTFDNTGTNCE